jgi:hypothetical protein
MADTRDSTTRLLDDPTTPSELRQLLEIGFEAPSAVQAARLRARVQAAQVPSAAPAPPGLGWARASAVGAVLLIVGLVWLAVGRPVSGPPLAPGSPVAAPRMQPARPAAERAMGTQPAQLTATEPEDAPATDRPVATRPAPGGRPPSDELSLLQQARALLEANPARALQLTRLHAHHFPDGLVAQERELLAVEALLRLGRTRSATQRAQAFLDAYPRSSHRRRIEALIEVQESRPAAATESAGETP